MGCCHRKEEVCTVWPHRGYTVCKRKIGDDADRVGLTVTVGQKWSPREAALQENTVLRHKVINVGVGEYL